MPAEECIPERLLSQSTLIAGNHAMLQHTGGSLGGGDGAGVYFDGAKGGEVILDNVTMAGNLADGNGDGLYLDGKALIVLKGGSRIEEDKGGGKLNATHYNAVYNLAEPRVGGVVYQLPTPPGTYAPQAYECVAHTSCWHHLEYGTQCAQVHRAHPRHQSRHPCLSFRLSPKLRAPPLPPVSPSIPPQICDYARPDFAGRWFFNVSFTSPEVPSSCPVGYFCDGDGTMQPCAVGIVSEARDACGPCPLRATQGCKGGDLLCSVHAAPRAGLRGGPKTVADCVCTQDYYRYDEAMYDCLPCPRGASCANGTDTIATLDVRPNYWRPNAHTTPLACSHEGICAGGMAPTACAGDLSGPFCMSCAVTPNITATYYFDTSRLQCRECSETMQFLGTVVLVGCLAAVLRCTCRRARRGANAAGDHAWPASPPPPLPSARCGIVTPVTRLARRCIWLAHWCSTRCTSALYSVGRRLLDASDRASLKTKVKICVIFAQARAFFF